MSYQNLVSVLSAEAEDNTDLGFDKTVILRGRAGYQLTRP